MRSTGSSQKSIDLKTVVLLALLAATIAAVFLPLTQYFFAQDDFKLLLKASYRGERFLESFFSPRPGQFRPLSKLLYFKVMYSLFGLDPLPFHIASLFFYIVNGLLLHVLLRRFGLSAAASFVTVCFFTLNTIFLNVVAWISCIQQLLGQFFGLLFLLAGIASIERRSTRLAIAAGLSYLLAVASMEQVFALPLVLAAWMWFFGRGAGAESSRTLSLYAAPAFLSMLLYLLFMLFWKGVPEGGPYEFHFGWNIVTNLLAYLHWAYDFSIEIPFLINSFEPGFSLNHVAILAIVLLNLARGRKRIVVLSAVYYGATILPVLFLRNHTYLIHTYIPSPAAMLLLGFVAEDFIGLLEKWKPGAAAKVPIASLVLLAVMSYTQVKRNVNNFLGVDYPLPKDYVLRRAIVAENAYRDIMERKKELPPDGKFFMVYMDQRSWYMDNVVASLGEGSAIKLFYGSPDLQVFSHEKGDTLDAFTPGDSQVLFFDHYGRFYTDSELSTKGTAIGTIPPGR